MRIKSNTKTSLLENGLVVCDKCRCDGDHVQARLCVGDTYSGDACDRCGKYSEVVQ